MLICIILLVNIIFYAKTIRYGYVSDDILSAKRNHPINVWKWAFWVFEGKLKSRPDIDHLLTTVLHSLVCVGIYLAFGRNDVSFIASLLFAVNPINNQGSVWISGRGYVLSALGMVWALALPKVGALFLLVATYSNSGFVMPLALIGSNHPYLLLWMPLIWMFHMERLKANVASKMKVECFDEDKAIHPRKLILATKTFGFYLSHALIPIKTTFYHSLLESIAGSRRAKAYNLCRFFWIGAFSISVMIWYVCTHRWDMICFGILWWCVGIAPFLNLYRMNQEIAERYGYVPNVGLMFIVAKVLSPYPVAVAFLLGVYATKMWFYMDAYRNDTWLVEFSRMNSDDAWFTWHIHALKKWDQHSSQEAFIFWQQALQLSPNEFKILFNLATVSYVGRNYKGSAEYLKKAEENIPKGQEKMANELIWRLRHGDIVMLT